MKIFISQPFNANKEKILENQEKVISYLCDDYCGVYPKITNKPSNYKNVTKQIKEADFIVFINNWKPKFNLDCNMIKHYEIAKQLHKQIIYYTI